MGVVWRSLDGILTRHGLRHHLKGAFTVEMLPYLAAAVPKWRAEQKRLGPVLRVERLARDVWDLLRQDGALMLH
eukprot:15474103-Alexandrium_andersonii.AAC.1